MSIINNKMFQMIIGVIAVALFIMGLRVVVSGQDLNTQKTSKPVQEEKLPPMVTDYKNVKIGMTADEVKDILGKPKVSDNDGFFYIISKEEQVQIGLDENQKVRVIVAMYSDKNGTAPTYKDIFGTDIEIAKQSNGNIYNLVRYEDEGIWIAYHRTAGNEV